MRNNIPNNDKEYTEANSFLTLMTLFIKALKFKNLKFLFPLIEKHIV